MLVDRFTIRLAPVFDNGNAFFNKRNPSLTERRLGDQQLVEQDALQGRSFFTDDEDHHIHPFRFIVSMQNEDCNMAVLRFARRLNLDAVRAIIDEIPKEAFDLPVMSQMQKDFYKNLLETGYEKGILPVLEKLISQKRMP